MIDRYEMFVSFISGIHRDIQKIERDEMEKYGLKGIYAQYLVVMHRYPDGITATELSDVCDKDKAAVSRAIHEMGKKGLLRKQTGCDNGYRAKLVLTEKGMAAADYVCRRAVCAVQIAGADIDEETRVIMYRGLREAAGRIRRISKEGIPD